MSKRLSIAVTCPDRFGLVQEVTAALGDLGLNLRDTTFAHLDDDSAELVAVCEGPDDLDETAVRRAILDVPGAEGGTVLVGVFELTSTHRAHGATVTHRLELHGGDVRGLVSRITGIINAHGGANVRLSTSVMPIPGSNSRTTVRVSIRLDGDAEAACRDDVTAFAKEHGMVCAWTRL